jgi:serine/threonine protein kinase
MSAQDEKEKDPLIGTTFANRYAIHGRLGKGGMAVVYRATDTQMGRDVAVKVLRTDVADEVAAKRLIREAKGAGALNHPNIITIFDRGIADDRVYIAMEILQGQEMSALMEEEGAIPVERALKIAEQVASALSVAHAEGIIHRDIKPENLFLLSRGGGDIVKMLDFSIAKLPKEMVTQQLTRAGSVFGTPHYMAPEQVEGKQAVPQTDLYALGAVLYELIVGEPPFDGASVIDILLKHVKTPAPRLERPGLELPPGLADLVAALLAKKPSDRPQTADAVREQLGDMLREVRRNPTAAPPSNAPPSSLPPSGPPPQQAAPQPSPATAATPSPPVRAVIPRMPTQMPKPMPKAAEPAMPTRPPVDADDERTIVGVGMSAQLNEMVKAQRAAQAAHSATGKPVAVPMTRPPTAPHPMPSQSQDETDEAKTMAVSRETLQAVQAAQAARRPQTMVPPARLVSRETVDDRQIGRDTLTDLPQTVQTTIPEKPTSKLWLIGVAIAAGGIGAAFAYWFVNRAQ